MMMMVMMCSSRRLAALLCCAACAKKKRRVITTALVYAHKIISKLGLNENVCPARTGPGHLRVAAAAPIRTNWLFFHHFMLFLFTYELVAAGGRRLLIDLSVQTAAEYNHKRPLKSFFCVLTHDKKKKKLLNYIFPHTYNLYLYISIQVCMLFRCSAFKSLSLTHTHTD